VAATLVPFPGDIRVGADGVIGVAVGVGVALGPGVGVVTGVEVGVEVGIDPLTKLQPVLAAPQP
jgi:hypothetical protein